MLGPAQHRADAKATYIHPLDRAWDHDRIRREKKAIILRNLEIAKTLDSDAKTALYAGNMHPVDAYFVGWTRYDLTAPLRLFVPGQPEDAEGKSSSDHYAEVKITDYLQGEADRFELTRLTGEMWRDLNLRITGKAEAVTRINPSATVMETWCLVEEDRARAAEAILVAAVAGLGVSLAGDADKVGRAVAAKAEELYRKAADLPDKLGNAVMLYSGPPREHELFLSA